jgi:hypothetical protein
MTAAKLWVWMTTTLVLYVVGWCIGGWLVTGRWPW